MKTKNFFSVVFAVVALLTFALISQSEQLRGGINQLTGGVHKTVGKTVKVPGLIGCRMNTQGGISHVYYDSPAQRAGMLVGDVVLSVNFRKFRIEDVHGEPGDVIYFTVKRKLPKLVINDYVLPEREEMYHLQIKYTEANKIDRNTNPQWYYEREQLIEVGPVT